MLGPLDLQGLQDHTGRSPYKARSWRTLGLAGYYCFIEAYRVRTSVRKDPQWSRQAGGRQSKGPSQRCRKVPVPLLKNVRVHPERD